MLKFLILSFSQVDHFQYCCCVGLSVIFSLCIPLSLFLLFKCFWNLMSSQCLWSYELMFVILWVSVCDLTSFFLLVFLLLLRILIYFRFYPPSLWVCHYVSPGYEPRSKCQHWGWVWNALQEGTEIKTSTTFKGERVIILNVIGPSALLGHPVMILVIREVESLHFFFNFQQNIYNIAWLHRHASLWALLWWIILILTIFIRLLLTVCFQKHSRKVFTG